MKQSQLKKIIREVLNESKKYDVLGHEWVLINPPSKLLKYFEDDPDQESDIWLDSSFWSKKIEPLIKKHLGSDYARSPKDNAYYANKQIYLAENNYFRRKNYK